MARTLLPTLLLRVWHIFHRVDKLHGALRSTQKERCKRYLRAHQRATLLERVVIPDPLQNSETLRSSHARLQTLSNSKKTWWGADDALSIFVHTAASNVPAALVRDYGPTFTEQNTEERKGSATLLSLLYCQFSLCNIYLHLKSQMGWACTKHNLKYKKSRLF